MYVPVCMFCPSCLLYCFSTRKKGDTKQNCEGQVVRRRRCFVDFTFPSARGKYIYANICNKDCNQRRIRETTVILALRFSLCSRLFFISLRRNNCNKVNRPTRKALEYCWKHPIKSGEI